MSPDESKPGQNISFPLKVKTTDENLQVVNRQTSRLMSDLVALQQERDSLKQDVSVLHKQLQHSNNKVRFYLSAKQPYKNRKVTLDFLLRTLSWRWSCTQVVCRIRARSFAEKIRLSLWGRSCSSWSRRTADFRPSCTASRATSSSPEKRSADIFSRMESKRTYLLPDHFVLLCCAVIGFCPAGPSAWCHGSVAEQTQAAESVLPSQSLRTGERLSETRTSSPKGADSGTNKLFNQANMENLKMER